MQTQTSAMLDVACPSCGEVYHVREENLGKQLKCRRCDHIFELRAPANAPASASASASTPSASVSSTGASTAPATAPSSGTPPGPTHPIPVTDADFARTVLQSPRPVLVDFWAPWCAPCRAIAPALEQLATEYGGRVTIAKLNTDENQRTMAQYGVQGIPALLIFKGGQEVGRLVGLRPKQAIKQALDQVI
jgi:thioredoxin 1